MGSLLRRSHSLNALRGIWGGGEQVNFRGQAQERIVVLTDCAVYTCAYDFAKNKIDNDRVHRHVHEHFKHITYGTATYTPHTPRNTQSETRNLIVCGDG